MQVVDDVVHAGRIVRGLRRIRRHPYDLAQSRLVVADEVARRSERFLRSLDELVWPFPASPTRRLLEVAGVEAGDVRALVASDGLVGALERLRDAGAYVAYDEYQGTAPAVRGSTTLSFGPRDFFNPVVQGDYMATTGGSRGTGTPMALSFAWQHRAGLQRPLRDAETGVAGAPAAVWLPVLPSAAGFGAVMKGAAGGVVAERWFSQVPLSLKGIATNKQLFNRVLPLVCATAGLPRPEHVPTDRAEVVLDWARDALARAGAASISGYASSITALAALAVERGVSLEGLVAYPASEPVTSAKLAVMRSAGIRPHAQFAFVPEGTMGFSCPSCDDEEYHLWDHELAVVDRARLRHAADDVVVPALLLTSLAREAPRVLLNVENDDYGVVARDVPCDCELGRLGLTTRLSGIRGISKVVAAGISVDGRVFDDLVERVLPGALGGAVGDFQFVEVDEGGPTRLVLRVHPRLGPLDDGRVRAVVSGALGGSDTAVLARAVWQGVGQLEVARLAPTVTRSGKAHALERLAAPAERAVGTSR